MKYYFAGFGMIMIGLISFVIVMLFQTVTINNESDYYSLKEAMEASMVEAIDIAYYRTTGEIKIVEEKFVSNFTRRFVKNTMGNSTGYIIEFYDIMEKPPKASIIIKNGVSSMSISDGDFTVVNHLTGILEANIAKNVYLNDDGCENVKSSTCATVNDASFFSGSDISITLNVPNECSSKDNVRVSRVIVDGFSNVECGGLVAVQAAISDPKNNVISFKALTNEGNISGTTYVKYNVEWKYDICVN